MLLDSHSQKEMKKKLMIVIIKYKKKETVL